MTVKESMHDKLRRLAVSLAVLALLGLGAAGAPAAADETESSNASAHLLQAELALQSRDYRKAAREYRRAAEASDSVDIARQATRVGSSFGFNDDALIAAKRWLKLDPDSDEGLFHLARLELRTGDTRAARRSYAKLLERGDEPPERRLLSLISVFGEEDPALANEVMQGLAKPYRKSPEANYAAAVTALATGDLETARERAERAIELEPGDWLATKSKLLYGRILLLSGEQDRAIDYVARIIGDDPHPDPGARMELALIMMSADRYDDALSQVNQILLENSANADALRLMAIINYRQENLDAAWEDFEDLLASGQHTMDALFYLGRIADFREQTERAIRLYAQVLDGPHAVSAQRRAAALIAYEREQPDRAFERLDEFARDNPQHAIDMVLAKAQLSAALERFDDALGYYDRMVEYRPSDENVLLGRAELLLRMDRLDDAIAQYRQAVDRFPKSAQSLNALGYTLADRTDRFREAEKLIRKALKYDPDSPAIIDSLGWVLHKLGRHEEALVELERAYERLDDPEVAAHIVEVLAVLARDEEALQFLVAAETKDPESPLLKDVRERVFPNPE